MNTPEIKLDYTRKDNNLIVQIGDYELIYELKINVDYTYYGGAATMREAVENIENEEASTHYLILKDTDWNTIIHGYVATDFYLTNSDDGICGTLEVRSTFTGLSDSQFARIETTTLGTISKNDNGLTFTTVDGSTEIIL